MDLDKLDKEIDVLLENETTESMLLFLETQRKKIQKPVSKEMDFNVVSNSGDFLHVNLNGEILKKVDDDSYLKLGNFLIKWLDKLK